MSSKNTTATTLGIRPCQIRTYRDYNHLVQMFGLLTRNLVPQNKSGMPHPVYVCSYLASETHINLFQLIGNIPCIMVVPYVHLGKMYS